MSYPELLVESQAKVLVPEAFYRKAKYLCGRYHKVEWSGILLYSIEGSMSDPDNLGMTLQDIILMDVGTSGYTSYNFNEKQGDSIDDRYIDYVIEHPHAMEWKIGHIHSHNYMNVFFSKTDMEELHENAAAYNVYLSVITNNVCDYTAKFVCLKTRRFLKTEHDASIKDFTGQDILLDASEPEVIEEHQLLVFTPEVQLPDNRLEEFDQFFLKNTQSVEEKIKEAAAKKVAAKAPVKSSKAVIVSPKTKYPVPDVESFLCVFLSQEQYSRGESLFQVLNHISTNYEDQVPEDYFFAESDEGEIVYPDRFDAALNMFFPAAFSSTPDFYELLEVISGVLKKHVKSFPFIDSLVKVLEGET